MGLKGGTVFMVYSDGEPLTWVAHESKERATAAATGWAAWKDYRKKKVQVVELTVTTVYKAVNQ